MVWFGMVLCALFGVELGGVAAGAIHLTGPDGNMITLFVVCINLAPWTGLAGIGLLVNAGRRVDRKTEEPYLPLPPLQPVLAKIEASRAVGEGPDIPLRLDLTIAPDGSSGYRVEADVTVNLMDLDNYRVGRTVVAAYDPERPWRVEIPRTAPSFDWADRAANAAIDSAPIENRVTKPRPNTALVRKARPLLYRLSKYSTFVGVAASVVLFWKQFTG